MLPSGARLQRGANNQCDRRKLLQSRREKIEKKLCLTEKLDVEKESEVSEVIARSAIGIFGDFKDPFGTFGDFKGPLCRNVNDLQTL